ncbi:DMT family transporter [Pelagibius sp.]|uniref:DMT family transporter n=1 Tax=Pelagibius sp. TaxID=1931238 RepID=UPI003B502744
MVILLGLVWGLNFSLMKFAAQSGLPFALLAALVILGNLLIFAACCLLVVGRIRVAATSWWFFAGCGLLGYLLPFFMELFAAPRIGAGTLALVVALAPIMTLLAAGATRIEQITWTKALGIGAGFLSVVPLMLQDVSALEDVFGIGLAVGLAVPLVYALYHTLIARFWPPGLESFEVAFGETFAAVVLMVPVYLLWAEPGPPPSFSISLYWIVGALLVFSALEVWLYFRIMRLGGPVYVSQSGYVAVIAGVVWGALFFDERVTAWIAASMALVLLALLLVAPRSRGADSSPDGSDEDSSGEDGAG